MKSDRLKTSAKANSVKEFEFSYFSDIDEALLEGLEQNNDFFTLLLNNDDLKKEVLGIFTEEIYKSLRESDNNERKVYPETWSKGHAAEDKTGYGADDE